MFLEQFFQLLSSGGRSGEDHVSAHDIRQMITPHSLHELSKHQGFNPTSSFISLPP